mgnify:CR=1 FL=1
MRTGGCETVKLRFPDISKELAQEISNSDYRSLKRLCQGIISTLKPSVPDLTLIELLTENEDTNIAELLDVEGKAQDIGGYFNQDEAKAEDVMRPSETLNAIINAI